MQSGWSSLYVTSIFKYVQFIDSKIVPKTTLPLFSDGGGRVSRNINFSIFFYAKQGALWMDIINHEEKSC